MSSHAGLLGTVVELQLYGNDHDNVRAADAATVREIARLECGTRTDDNSWAWTWVLIPTANGTRLLSRTRMDTRGSTYAARLAMHALMVPASWVMERKMLLGLRERAESSG